MGQGRTRQILGSKGHCQGHGGVKDAQKCSWRRHNSQQTRNHHLVLWCRFIVFSTTAVILTPWLHFLILGCCCYVWRHSC